jgi:hypothetical protein
LTEGGRLAPGRVAFSPTRNVLAATAGHTGVLLYDLDSKEERLAWKPEVEGLWAAPDLAFSLDGSKLAIYVRMGRLPLGNDEVLVINALSLEVERRFETLYARLFHCGAVRLSPDARYLYFARSDNAHSRYSIRCVDLRNGQQVW